MKTNVNVLSTLAAALLATELTAAEPAFPSEWQHAQSFSAPRAGLMKISVPLEILSASRSGLEDLRLFDASGREVPYLLERPSQPRPLTQAPSSFQVNVRTDATIVALATPSDQAVTAIVLQTPSRDFLKAVQIEGSTNGQNWTVLAEGQVIFRQMGGASKLQLDLPRGMRQALRLTVDDRRSPPIPITGALLHLEAASTPAAEAVELGVVQRLEEPGHTRLLLHSAGLHYTLAGLTLETPETLFTRSVTLAQQHYVENEIREQTISQDSLYRVALEGRAPVQGLTLAVDAPVRSRELVLTINNDDNPPLAVTALRARRWPVHLTFNAAQSGRHFLLTGNPQCAAPRYDLANLRASLKDTVAVPVDFGALTTNAGWRAVDLVADIPDLGTGVDVAQWQFRKRVRIAAGGIQQLELDWEVLSRAGTSGADLRLLREGRQIPFLLERTALSRSREVPLKPADDPKRPTVSRWQITLPHASLPLTRLTFTTPAPFFKRDVRLYEDRPDDRGSPMRIQLSSTVWVRNPGKAAAPLPLDLTLAPVTDTLILEIENGDNPPLELRHPEAWCPVIRAVFKSPAEAETWLYYGNRKVGRPQYDLELAAPRILAAEKGKASLGAEERLKAGGWGDGSGWGGKAGWLFWTALGIVVAGLIFVLARLLPKPQSGGNT